MSLSDIALATTLHLIPLPQHVQECHEIVQIPKQIKIEAPAQFKNEQNFLEQTFAQRDSSGFGPAKRKAKFEFVLDPKIANSEGYQLILQPERFEIHASSAKGAYYGVVTLRQLLRQSPHAVPCVQISDAPRFGWRGLHLDVARHFYDSTSLVRLFDLMAEHKLNVFHWHLTDDQGWRLQSPSYPKLTEIGAWRVEHPEIPWNERKNASINEKPNYGGFYSQEQVRGIIAEANKRQITIIPEVEIPAHAAAALAAYPEFSCSGRPTTVPTGSVWPEDKVFCPGRPEVIPFLDKITDEIADLFPSPWIHLGQDEADLSAWALDSSTQALQKKLGLKSPLDLQNWIYRHLADRLAIKGKKALAWDEALTSGNLPPKSGILAWHGSQEAFMATAKGVPAVLAMENILYFDHAQDPGSDEPQSIGGYTPLDRVFGFQIPKDHLQDSLLLGMQAQLWTEYLPNLQRLDYAVFPRMAALAERAWSEEVQGDSAQAYHQFLRRLLPHEDVLMAQGFQFEHQGLRPNIETAPLTEGILEVRLLPVLEEYPLRCLLNPSLDWDQAQDCSNGLLRISSPTTLSVAAFKGDKRYGKVLKVDLTAHVALGKRPVLKFAASPKYNGKNGTAMVDGRLGSSNFGDGRWTGFEGVDIIGTWDFLTPRTLHELRVGFLLDSDSWILLPISVEAQGSRDGVQFESLGAILPPQISDKNIWRPIINWKNQSFRYYRLVVHNLGQCPVNHPGHGNECWTFVDEIEWR